MSVERIVEEFIEQLEEQGWQADLTYSTMTLYMLPPRDSDYWDRLEEMRTKDRDNWDAEMKEAGIENVSNPYD